MATETQDIQDGLWTREQLEQLRTVRPAWSAHIPETERRERAEAMHRFARQALAQLDEAESSGDECAAWVRHGEVIRFEPA